MMKRCWGIILCLVLVFAFACAACAEEAPDVPEAPDGSWKLIRMMQDGAEYDMEENHFFGYILFLSGNKVAMILGDDLNGMRRQDAQWTQDESGNIILNEEGGNACLYLKGDVIEFSFGGIYDMTFRKYSSGIIPSTAVAGGYEDFEGTWKFARATTGSGENRFMIDAELFAVITPGSGIGDLQITDGTVTLCTIRENQTVYSTAKVAFSDGMLKGTEDDSVRIELYDSGEIGVQSSRTIMFFTKSDTAD